MKFIFVENWMLLHEVGLYHSVYVSVHEIWRGNKTNSTLWYRKFVMENVCKMLYSLPSNVCVWCSKFSICSLLSETHFRCFSTLLWVLNRFVWAMVWQNYIWTVDNIPKSSFREIFSYYNFHLYGMKNLLSCSNWILFSYF